MMFSINDAGLAEFHVQKENANLHADPTPFIRKMAQNGL